MVDVPDPVMLDTTGLICPLPILKAKKAIKSVPAGGQLVVLATDPGAKPDFETFCELGAYSLVEQSERDGVFRFVIQT
ncbi:MAG: sulfurtransferase TusA family protein [Pseudomonadota bacterium]